MEDKLKALQNGNEDGPEQKSFCPFFYKPTSKIPFKNLSKSGKTLKELIEKINETGLESLTSDEGFDLTLSTIGICYLAETLRNEKEE